MFIQNYELAPVKSAKVLGIHLSTDLKWDLHIAHIVAKGSKRLYYLRLPKSAGVDQNSLVSNCLHHLS